jgi:hypothetical protein
MVGADIEELTEHSSAVIVGVVESTHAQWSTDFGRIYTHTYVRVEESVVGSLTKGRRIHIKQIGGTVGGSTMHLPGPPKFAAGEKVVLFLRARKVEAPLNVEEFDTAGWFQGKFLLDRAGIASRPTRWEGVHLVGEKTPEPGELRLPLTELRIRVRQAWKGVQP